MATKKKALKPNGAPPPPAVSMPTSSGQEVFIHHLQQEKKDDQDLQMTTKLIRIQGALNQLLTEVRVMNWDNAEDAKIHDAIQRVRGWESRKLSVGTDFQDYEAMVTKWHPPQLTQPGSEYTNLKTEVENFYSDFTGAIANIKEEDRDRNLGTLEKTPTSLMEYPQVGGLDIQCYFKWGEKMTRV